MASYLRFKTLPQAAGDWKAGSVAVLGARTGDVLGMVSYYPAWRRFVFEPAPETVWSCDCLADVQARLVAMNAARKQEANRGG